MTRRLSVLLLPLLLSGCVIHVDGTACSSADYESNQAVQLDGAGLTALQVNAEAGRLEIIGDPAQNNIAVEAVLYSSGPEADEHQFSLVRQGDVAVLTATQNSQFGCWNDSPHIDMVVRVPAGLALEVEDGSGDMTLHGMTAPLNIDDGSGSLTINGGQTLRLVDGSGDTWVEGIAGNATVEDGSGSLRLSKMGGDVRVDDGSGDLTISDVAGQVEVSDGSGSLVVESVQGNVTVDDGSGDIRIRQTGGFTLIEGGSGGLSVSDVNGPVTLN
ncbi:DUF4097 domain-containing protein [Ferrimonas balearica]|uniref:DUF4097 domain-containing protein n=1 Tax=Ferrimonas balearica TaxID=44012 RepID=UPI001C960100|nr:DUF4097 domain-containing protein [Ferrimonas balearica]MBY6224262.1 DUF4097 domain-containing protein [Ferrimonas balearica]